jgi:branched-chain amino acid transport system permease protein
MLAQLLVNGLVVGSGYALIAVGHTMIFGLMRIVNFAHGELYMIGAFLTFTFVSFVLQLNYFLALAIAMCIIIVLAVVIERTMISRLIEKDIATTTLITIGMSIFFINIVQTIWGANPRSLPHPFKQEPFQILGVFITRPRLFILVAALAVIITLHFCIQKTKIGKAFRATFQNREAALLAGINIRTIYTISYSLGSFLAALAGGLLGMIYIIEPTMGVMAIGKAFTIVIVAGRRSYLGAIAVGYGLGIIESLGAGYISSEYKDVFAFVILIIVLVVKPEGIFGKLRSSR